MSYIHGRAPHFRGEGRVVRIRFEILWARTRPSRIWLWAFAPVRSRRVRPADQIATTLGTYKL